MSDEQTPTQGPRLNVKDRIAESRQASVKSKEDLFEILLVPIKRRLAEQDSLINALKGHATKMDQSNQELTKAFKELKAENARVMEELVVDLRLTLEGLANRAESIELQNAAPRVTIEEVTKEIESALNKFLGELNVGKLDLEPSTEYEDGTLGKRFFEVESMLSAATSAFINLGDVQTQFVVAKSVKAAQTLVKARCPVNLESADLELITGGKQGDLILLSSEGLVKLVTTGNLSLKEPYTLMTGRFIALKKTKDYWEELWRSH